MESGLLLDVVVGEGSAVLELLTGEDKSLLIRWDSLFVLDLGLDILDGIRWLNVKSDSFTSQGLDEDLHTTSESEDQMESGLLLDDVVGEGSAVRVYWRNDLVGMMAVRVGMFVRVGKVHRVGR